MTSPIPLQAPLEELLFMLKSHLDMDLWMLTRVLGDDWIIVATSDNNYGVSAGNVLPWKESVCSRMVEQKGPNIVSNISENESYQGAPIVKKLPISSYVGFPILDENEELLGTLCAIDQSTKNDSIGDSNAYIKSLLHVAQTLMNQHDTILRLDMAVEKISKQSKICGVTGLGNQEAFFESAKAFKTKYHSLGAPIGVVIIEVSGIALKSKSSDVTYRDLIKDLSVDMAKVLRKTDSLYKLDGSKFAVLMINVETRFVGSMVMKLSKSLEKFKLKVSIGADVCRDGASIEESIERANTNRMI